MDFPFLLNWMLSEDGWKQKKTQRERDRKQIKSINTMYLRSSFLYFG